MSNPDYNNNQNQYPPLDSGTNLNNNNTNGMPQNKGSPVYVEKGHNVSQGRSTCQHCNRETATLVRTKNGSFVWLMCLLFFLLTCCLFFVPFLVEDWKDKEYRCEGCGNAKFVEKGSC
jgi:hypothetical protein